MHSCDHLGEDLEAGTDDGGRCGATLATAGFCADCARPPLTRPDRFTARSPGAP